MSKPSSWVPGGCTGEPGECDMGEGQCVWGIADDGLPADRRKYADFMWQRSPFELVDRHGDDGAKQSPGRDLSEPYWLARHYNFIQEGRGQVTAWRDTGAAGGPHRCTQ